MSSIIKKTCKLFESNGTFTLQPRGLFLEDHCFAHATHTCNDYLKNDIFDFRSTVLNNHIKQPLHFYMHLFDENMNRIEIESNYEGYSLVFTFNRKCTGYRNKKLNYYPYISKNRMQVYNNLIYLGISELVTNSMVAYETNGCVGSNFSKNGGGFYGFQFNINTGIKPKHAVLYGLKNKIISRNNFQRNNIIELSSQSEESYYSDESEESDESEGSYDSLSSSEETHYPIYAPVPTAPPYIAYAMPSAPIAPISN